MLAAVGMLLWNCSPRAVVVKNLHQVQRTFQDHTGFYLYDPSAKKTLIDFNGATYFIPASNTKIFTFYTALKLLGDSTTVWHYAQRNDSLILWGTGDPSFLYPYVHQTGKAFQFLKNTPAKLFLSTQHSDIVPLGPGWSWSDYTYSYSAERSAVPIYGNLIRATKRVDNTIHTVPGMFMEHVAYASDKKKEEELIRDIDSNLLTYFPGEKSAPQEWEIPFRATTDLVAELLSDTLKRPVEEINMVKPRTALKVAGTPLDSLYKVMMQESDNFIAEQLLIMCAGAVSDTLKSEIAIDYATKNLLTDLPDRPIWVDGSGLSRYNLFTPRAIVKLWEKIGEEVPTERLLPLLATGGKNGTIRNWYKADKPFIYGKTGTLLNNHCLSGYLITRKGKKLIFSFMNNNFTASGTEVRKEMEKILFYIRDQY